MNKRIPFPYFHIITRLVGSTSTVMVFPVGVLIKICIYIYVDVLEKICLENIYFKSNENNTTVSEVKEKEV